MGLHSQIVTANWLELFSAIRKITLEFTFQVTKIVMSQKKYKIKRLAKEFNQEVGVRMSFHAFGKKRRCRFDRKH
jgi:hypothetical protein